MKYAFRQKSINISLLLIVAFLSIYLTYSFIKSQAQDVKSYDPRDYGLPTHIGIHQIVAVIAPENMTCPVAGMYTLILESPVDQRRPSQNQPVQRPDIERLERLLEGQVTLSYSSGGMTLEQVQRQAEEIKASHSSSDCLPIGKGLRDLANLSH